MAKRISVALSMRVASAMFGILLFLPGVALAAGLPQLDAATYGPQLIWLAISFALLYWLMVRLILPRVSQVLDERQQRIESNLERAEKLKTEADEAKASYEKTLSSARAEAQEVLHKTSERLAAEAAERHAALASRLGNDVRAAEARIDDAKTRALAGIQDVAVETALAATRRLIGEAPDNQSVTAAVQAVLGERR